MGWANAKEKNPKGKHKEENVRHSGQKTPGNFAGWVQKFLKGELNDVLHEYLAVFYHKYKKTIRSEKFLFS